jgi:AsmA-like C-terminal region
VKGLIKATPRRLRVRVRTLRDKVEDALRWIGAWVFGLAFLLILAGVPTLLFITSTAGLGDEVRLRSETLLGGKNYEVHLQKVLFNPTRGFVLEGIQVYDKSPNRRLVVSANRLAVSMNMDSLIRGTPQIERIYFRDASMDIPLGSGPEPRLRLDRVKGLILCPPDQLRVQEASFELAGIRVSMSGTFLNPKKFAPRSVASGGEGNTTRTIDVIQTVLKGISWTGASPTLTIEAGGDLADVETLRVSRAEFDAHSGTWRGISLRRISLVATYAARIMQLEKLEIEDDMGIFQAAGSADFLKNRGYLEFNGGIDPTPFPVFLMGKDKGCDWVFSDPLRLNGSVSADWSTGSPLLNGTMQFSSRGIRSHGILLEECAGGVAYREGKILLRDLRVAGDPGNLTADLMIAPGDNRIRLNASLFPKKFAPLAGGQTAEALGAMDFKEPLRVSFEGGMPGKNPLELKGSGSLSLGEASMRGAPIEGLSARLEVDGGAVDFRDILVRMGGGTGRGEFVYDYRNWEGRFPDVRTTLDPVKVMAWIDPRVSEGLKPYRFSKPPETKLTGKVGLKNPDKNDLRIAVNSPSGMDYTLIGKDLSFGAISGTILLKGQKLLIDIPSARLFGGGVSFRGDVSVIPGDARYGAAVHLDGVDFRDLTKLYFGYDESGGSLTADYAFRTIGGDDLAMTGKGNLRIQDGNVLAMPVLGPLSLMMGEVIPGLGYQTAREATADFSVENGVITTRDLLIKGKGFSMIGNGKIHYLQDAMEMNIRLNAQGLPGMVLFPVSKIFEYESVGSAKHPKWRPKLLPKIGGSASPTPSPNSSPSP